MACRNSCSTVLPKLCQDIFAFYVDLIFTSSTDRRSQSRSVRHTALKDNFFLYDFEEKSTLHFTFKTVLILLDSVFL